MLDYLESLTVMEPSHQPFNLRGARAFAEAFPGLPQVACFNLSFHRSMPEVAQTYALPQRVRDAGVRHSIGAVEEGPVACRSRASKHPAAVPAFLRWR